MTRITARIDTARRIALTLLNRLPWRQSAARQAIRLRLFRTLCADRRG